jgi:hypothetical protein
MPELCLLASAASAACSSPAGPARPVQQQRDSLLKKSRFRACEVPLLRRFRRAPILLAVLVATLVSSVAARAACGNPAGAAGDNMYNSAYHVPQYCDGITWHAMGQQGAGGTGCGTTPSSSGLAGWWKFNDGSGTSAVDSSGNGNTGTTQNTPAWTTTGPNGGGLTFNGTSQYVQVPDAASLELTGSWTLSAWVKLSALPYNSQTFTLLSRDSTVTNSSLNYGLFVDNNGIGSSGLSWLLDFNSAGGGGADYYVEYPATINTGVWYHVAGVWDSSTSNEYLYVNGQLVATQNQSGYTPNSGSGPNESIGRDLGTYPDYTAGTLDDVRVYNRALSASEVAGLAGPGGKEGDIVYNSFFHVPQFCDGTRWIAMGPQGAGGAGCTTPTGSEGNMIYNSGDGRVQFCDGTEWRDVGAR